MKPKITFLKIKRECPYNEEATKNGKRILYDYDVLIDGVRRAQFYSFGSGSRGFLLEDLAGEKINEPDSSFSSFAIKVEFKRDFVPTVERVLKHIPTLKQIQNRQKKKQEAEARELAKYRNRVEIKIGVVPHGLEINVRNYIRSANDGNGVEVTNVCGDFAGDYEVGKICDAIGPAIIETLTKNLEKNLCR